MLALTALVGFGPAAYAAPPVLPQGGQFVAGAGVIGSSGPNALQINQQTSRGIIDWSSFSIGQGGSVVINNGRGATLNRVVGASISQIEGRLSATGSVYLVNPQGVVIGLNGKVVGGGSVVVSSRDVSNGAFMAGGAMTASGTSPGDVTNLGQIVSQQGNVLLIGRSVTNAGSIEAVDGTVNLAAGDSVLMAATDGINGVYVVPDASATGDVTEAGRIQAAAAALTAAGGDVYTLAGNRNDLIEARGTTTIAGQVWLSAPNGQVQAGGQVVARNADGSGGQIVAQGGQSTLLTGSLDASGLKGGAVYVGVTGPQQNLSQTTTIADGAVIKAGGPQGGGQVETSGHLLTVGSASVDTAGGRWLLDPTDLTIDSASGAVTTIVDALSSSDVTIETTSSGVSNSGVSGGIGTQASGAGDITVASAISWSSSHSLTLQAYNNLNVDAAITGSGSGDLTLVAGRAVTVGAAVSANTVSMTANGGDLTLNSGASITGTAASANSALLKTSANFVNNAGASAVQASGSGGYWRIYSTDPTQDTLDGLTPDFYQYGIGANPTVLGTGDGLLYSTSETVSYSLTGSVSKVYDGTTTLADGSITAANLSATGLLTSLGDAAAPADGSGTLSQSNVGSSLLVTLNDGVSVTRDGVPVYGYTTSGTIEGVIGSITPRPLTVDIVDGPDGITKIYDGNDTAHLDSSNFVVSGVAPADTGSILISPGPMSAVYTGVDPGTGHSAPDVGTAYELTVNLNATNYVVSSGSDILLTNYILPTMPENDSRAASGITPYANAKITPAPLQLPGLTADDKTYDGTATATVTATGVSGVIDGDNVSLGAITASFSNGGAAGDNIAITYSAALTGDPVKITDYTFDLPTLTANIAKASLTLDGLAVLNGGRVYDGTLTASIDASAGQLNQSQIVAGDIGQVGFDASGVTAQYAQADVGQNITVTVDPNSIALTGSKAGDYALSIPTLLGDITPRLLTIELGANAASKTYDGNADASVNPSEFTITGWAPGEGADVSIFQTASAFYTQGGVNQSNAGTYDVTANITVSDFKVTGSTNLSNYYTSLNGSTPVLSDTVVSAGGGVINPAPLSIQIVGNPTKTYDGLDTITLTSSDFQLSGFVNGESATVNNGVVGTFQSANVGPAIALTVSLNNPSDFNTASGALMSNYTFTNPVTGFGTINPAPITGAIAASLSGSLVKVYDGTVNITLTPSDFVLTGWQNGDGSDVSVTQNAGEFATPNAGTQTVYALLNNDSGRTGTATLRGDFTSTTTDLLDYTLPSFASGVGTIQPRAITISVVGTPTKVYDGTLDTPALTSGDYQVNNTVNGETITVSQPLAFYGVKNVGSQTVTASIDADDLSITGGNALLSNYTLGAQGTQTLQGTATGAGVINYAQLTILNVTANDKVYDGTDAATFNFSDADSNLFGAVAGDDVHLESNPGTGTFSTIHVGTDLTITPTEAFAITGTDSGNYQLVAPNLTADITPKTLTISGVTAVSRSYDAALDATLDNTNAQLEGVVGSDPVTLTLSTTGTFASKDVGTAIPVTASGYSLSFGNPAYSGDYVLQQPTGLTADITPAQLYGTIINTPTKTYDGSTTVTLVGGMGGSSSFGITGWQGSDGDGVTIDHAAVSGYLSVNAGSQTVSATLLTSNFVGISNLYDYYLPYVSGSPSQSTGTIEGPGLINKAPLIAQIVGDPTRVYNAALNYDSTTANTGANAGVGLLSSNYELLGFATGEGADVVVSQPIATFNVKDVGIRTLTASLTAGDITSTTTNLNNYILPTTATGAGTITPFQITVSGVTANNKTYDTTGTFTLNNSGASLVGIFSADSGQVSLAAEATSGSSTNGVDVGSHTVAINAGAYSLTGAAASDYVIDSIDTTTASITPAPLTLQVVKTYDASDDAGSDDAGNVYSLVGVLGGDAVSLGSNTFVGAYSSANVDGVIANPTVTLTSGAVNLTGAKALDYQVTGATGVINPLQVQVTGAVAQNQPYDGTTAATISNANTQLVGVLSADQGTIQLLSDGEALSASSITTGTFAQADVKYDASNNVAAIAVSTTGYSLGGNSHQDYVLEQPTGLSAEITPATVFVIPTGVTKVYDGAGGLPTSNMAYTLGDVLAADQGQVFINASLVTGSYDAVGGLYNVGSNLGVTLDNLSLTGARSGDYQIASTFTGNIGTITQASLTASILPQTKVYDGSSATTTSLLGQYVITGVHGEVGTLDIANGDYADSSSNDTSHVTAATQVVVTGLTAADFSDAGSTGGTLFDPANYILPTSISGVGTITPKPVDLLQATKTFDDGSTLTASNTNFVWDTSAIVSGDTVSLVTSGLSDASYSGDHANASGVTLASGSTAATGGYNVTVTGLTLSDPDYALQIPNGVGVIDPKTITASLSASKTYDGTTTADLTASNFNFSGFVDGQGVSLSVTGAYDQANASTNPVAPAQQVSVTLSQGDYTATSGALLSDYVLPTGPITGAGTINVKPVQLLQVEKTFDGTNSLTEGDATFIFDTSAIVSSDTGVALDFAGMTGATFGGFHANQSGVTLASGSTAASGGYTVSVSGLTLNNANYSLVTTGDIGVIDPKPISLTSVTKVYDSNDSLTGANSAFTLDSSAIVPGNPVSVDASGYVGGTYGGTQVVSGPYTVTVAGLTLTNSDYALTTPTGAIGTITARPIDLLEVTKVYDGGNSLTEANSTFTLDSSAIVAGDTVNVVTSGLSGSAAYSGVDANLAGFTGSNGYNVAATGLSLTNSNYVLNILPGIGVIDPKQLTIALTPQTKVYDATTGAVLTSADFLLSGFVGSNGATVTQTVGAYNSKNASSNQAGGPGTYATTVTALLTVGDFTATGGADFSNYVLPTSASGAGVITPAPLSVTNLSVLNKVYDGTTTAQLDLSNVTASSLTGVIAGDDVTLSSLPGGANFVTSNVGTNIQVTLTGQAITGADAGNYVLSSAALPTASITPRPLTAAIVGTPTKVYDDDTDATLTAADFLLSGFVAGQGATVTQTAGTYSAADAGARAVSTTLASGEFTADTGTLLSNYILPTSATGAGLITPRPLTATIIGDPSKYFDGDADATLTGGNILLTGFVGGQGATVSVSAGTYSGLGPSTSLTITAPLAPGDFAATGGANLANYVLPTTAVGPGVIKPPLSSDLSSRFENQVAALGVAPTPEVSATISTVVFSVATPRIYIPFPAPDALSTSKGNGFGSLPIVVDPTADYATQVSDDGDEVVQSGPAMINSTEQVLLQGARDKQYRIVLPSQAIAWPSPSAQ